MMAESLPWYVHQKGGYDLSGNIQAEDLKERVDIEDVLLALFGKEYKRSNGGDGWIPVCCPFHGDKKASAAVLRKNMNGIYFHCYACDASGDIFDLVQDEIGLSFKETIQWVADRWN